MSNIYNENGFQNRMDYLYSLSVDFEINIEDVILIADTLGSNEDFDGLVSSLADYCRQ